MKRRAFLYAVPIVAVFGLAANIAAPAQSPELGRYDKLDVFSGVINAYTPQGTTGPYEVRGPWTLTLNRHSGKAEFTAALNMELSDGWVITKNDNNFDPSTRDHHTHHVTLVGNVTWLANGFRVNGTATVTLNGGSAPVSPTPLEIDVTGGTEVPFSNIALTFGLPGSNHFGLEPLTGVVRSVTEEK